MKFIGGDLKGSKKYTAEVQESLLYNCDNFEKLLNGRDDFFNFTTKEFDATQTIQRFKPFLMDSISSEIANETEKKVFKTFFELTDAKIPIMLGPDDMLMCSKLIFSSYVNRICGFRRI